MTDFSVFWLFMGVFSVCLFWSSARITVLSIQQKKYSFLFLSIVLLVLQYFIIQCVSYHTWPSRGGAWVTAASGWFTSLPRWSILMLSALILFTNYLLFRDRVRHEKTQITGMSVKEAFDSLPSGLCYYLDGGRILMGNRSIEKFCADTTGEVLISGERLRRQVFSGELKAGCSFQMIGDTAVVTASDQTVWNITEQNIIYENQTVHLLQATEVTEFYQKTRLLQTTQARLSALNESLTRYNREIVALTAEKELLSARVHLHDEMGEDLLTIRNYLKNGGTEKDREAIETRLNRNLTFLRTGQASMARDEYELMMETAERLNVAVMVHGTLPETEPVKHIVATALHECLTNTLRHARGNELTLSVENTADTYIITFTNNGEQPTKEIKEKGGLVSLRKLAENAGGSMMISVLPSFRVQLAMPKEVQDGL